MFLYREVGVGAIITLVLTDCRSCVEFDFYFKAKDMICILVYILILRSE